ncbi:MAG: response regulator [bacterium]
METPVHHRRLRLLLVEDDEDDSLLLRDAMEESGLPFEFARLKDGEGLVDFLLRQGTFIERKDAFFPDLILLDLNLPRKDGREVLREIRNHPRLSSLPVIILTTSQNDDDVLQCYQRGANAFLRKPTRFDEIVEMIKSLHDFWFEKAELPRPGAPNVVKN